MQDLIVSAVTAGFIFLALALILHLRGLAWISQDLVAKWRMISGLISFFLIGYLLFLFVQIKHIEFPLEALTAIVFLGGGFFVLVITRITLRALKQVIASEKKLKELYSDLLQSNNDLVKAYDSTIAGWSHALDLRDQETEGHSQRVAALSKEIAMAMGMKGESLVHLTRGALLHDIGKMAIPDEVLLKKGPLTKEEREMMHLHPSHAYEMLSSIDYLKPALDIPYCHHERWDGSGYPRGLRGEEIPLAARIFAVADTWDALTSKRRYHQAWSEQKACEHIKTRSGSHFDPEVVKVFMQMGSCS